MLAPCGLILHFYIFFHFFSWTCAKKDHKYQYQDKKIEQLFYPHVHPSNIITHLSWKCNKNKYKNCKILKLQIENETKNKNLSM
jgi:hypothetical protein